MKKIPSLKEALLPIIFMMLSLTIGVGVLKLRMEPIMIASTFVASLIALKLGYTWKEIQDFIMEKNSQTLPALFILLSVGMLVGSLIFSGTVPMIIYYGVQIINPKFFLISTFLITAIISLFTGTSWGTIGTIGIALMGIAEGLSIPLAATAGAIVSGSFLGDKLSPLSDTTNMAAIATETDLYEHISHMLWTTIPSAILCILIYVFIGFTSVNDISILENGNNSINQLKDLFEFNIFLILPILLITIGSIKKWPIIPNLIGTSFFSILLGITVQKISMKNGFLSLVSGFNISMLNTSQEIEGTIKSLIQRGGVSSMLGTMFLIICAMSFAGVISGTGMLNIIIEVIMKKVKKKSEVILATIFCSAIICFITGSAYLSILILGNIFKDSYSKMNLKSKNLSRTLEDSGTILVPLIPWSPAGTYLAATLGIATIDYLPWAIFSYSGIIFAVIFGITGIGISEIKNGIKNLDSNQFSEIEIQ